MQTKIVVSAMKHHIMPQKHKIYYNRIMRVVEDRDKKVTIEIN